ncbi:hypothetical protein HN51_024723 [Arachis hypogaea]
MSNPDVHDILLQLPLPKHINEEKVLSEISLDEVRGQPALLYLVHVPKVIIKTALVDGLTQPAVPQTRKASLAHFLEKRKERVMNSAPYNLNEKSEEYGTTEHNGATSIASNALPLQVKQG